MEKQSKRTTELETVGNNVKLLTEMLEHFSPHCTSACDKDLMKVHKTCCLFQRIRCGIVLPGQISIVL